MHTKRFLVLSLAFVVLTACQGAPLSLLRPTETSTPAPTATATAEPTPTALPTATSIPTPAEVAPEKTFTEVGNVAQLSGEHGVSGKAIVAGLQTLIIQKFEFDGKGPQADIRLVKDEDYVNPAAILLELEPKPYVAANLHLQIPSAAGPGTANRIAVFCPETGEVYASAPFK